MADDLEDIIEAVAAKPKVATADRVSAEQHPLPDLIKADQYLSAKDAATKKHRGVRIVTMVPPGTQ